jgi:FkbM family methyltransferase
VLNQRLCHSMPFILAYRLSKFFLAREKQPPRRDFVAPTVTGSMYGYRTGDLLGDSVRMCGFWDWRALAVAKAVAGFGAHIIEIGANTGTETLGLADIVGPRGRVTAFEPDAANVEALQANLVRNRHSHVRVLSVAVSDRIGKVSFVPSSIACNSGVGYIDTAATVERPGVEVRSVTLDSLESELGGAAYIIVDVEGAELAVLAGAERYLQRYRPVLYLEANGEALMRSGRDLAELAARLRRLGYQPYEIRRLSTRPVSPVPVDRQAAYTMNWLAVPEERPALRTHVDRMLRLCAFAPRIANLHPLRRAPKERAHI